MPASRFSDAATTRRRRSASNAPSKPTRSSATHAPSSRSTSSRPTATRTRPSPRSSRSSSTRSSRTCPPWSPLRPSRCHATARQPAKTARTDPECSKRNLQRALAIDDAYMPALNQLALFYFQQAKKRVGAVTSSQKGTRGRAIATNAAIGKRANVQQLELAALVCSQAIRKNPSYAPIHNTAGLIQTELGQVNSAVREFQTAAQLDPKFFEAQMNFAAVNLSFRGVRSGSGCLREGPCDAPQ